MRVGITGGAGFIASHVIDALPEHEVLIFDHKGRGSPDRRGERVMLGDTRDETAVFELAAHVDAVIHLAGVLGTAETIANPRPAVETNVLGMVNVLAACDRYKLPLVFASVGNFQMYNTYSTTKVCAERLLYQYRDELGLAAAVVRPMNAYGPRQSVSAPFGPGKVRKIAPALICRALSGMPLEVYGDGSQVSDMVYVCDVARVISATLEHLVAGVVPTHSIEVGPTVSASVRDIALTVIEACVDRGYLPVPIVELPMRAGEMTGGLLTPEKVDEAVGLLVGLGVDVKVARQIARPLSNRVNADISTLDAVGIAPESLVSLEEGIGRTVDWYIEHEGSAWHAPIEAVA